MRHQSGTISGVAAVYNRFAYLEERKAALEAWGKWLADLVRPEAVRNNVIGMDLAEAMGDVEALVPCRELMT